MLCLSSRVTLHDVLVEEMVQLPYLAAKGSCKHDFVNIIITSPK